MEFGPLSSQVFINWGINRPPEDPPAARKSRVSDGKVDTASWVRSPYDFPREVPSELQSWTWAVAQQHHLHFRWVEGLVRGSGFCPCFPSQSLGSLTCTLFNAWRYFKMAKYIKCLTFPGCSASISTLLCVSRDAWRLLAFGEWRELWILTHLIYQGVWASQIYGRMNRKGFLAASTLSPHTGKGEITGGPETTLNTSLFVYRDLASVGNDF